MDHHVVQCYQNFSLPFQFHLPSFPNNQTKVFCSLVENEGSEIVDFYKVLSTRCMSLC